jgi:hypothetical protein
MAAPTARRFPRRLPSRRDASIILHRHYALADYGSSSGAVATTGIAVVVARGTKCRTAPVLILISLVRLSHPFPHRFLRYGDELVWASGINKPAPQVISSQCVLLAVHRERGERWSTADYGSGDQGMLKVSPSTRIIHLGRGQSIRQRERPTTSLPARMKSGSCRRSPLRTLSESFAGTNRDSWRDRSCPYASCLSCVRCGMPRPAIPLISTSPTAFSLARNMLQHNLITNLLPVMPHIRFPHIRRVATTWAQR